MNDLISRQAAIDEVEFGITYAKAIDKEADEVIELFKASNAELKKAIDRIKALHAAQPQRMRGRWKQTYLDHVAMGERPYILYCSACNQCIAYPTNFCPNCGADMRGKQDDPTRD